MDFNGYPIESGGGTGGDGVFDEICAKEIQISSDGCTTIEYTLPTSGPSGDGQVIIGDANGSTVWSELPAISNVEQRRILDEEIGLETFLQTANFSNAYNNFWKVLNGVTEPIYSGLVVCPNDNFRVFGYNNPPVTTGDLYKGANLAGGDAFAGGVPIYSHLYKDYDLSSFNDVAFDEVEMEVWLATSANAAYTYNVYIDIITSGSLPAAPVFNVQYTGVNAPVQTGINTPNNRIEKFVYKLNQQLICQASKMRVVFEAVTETGGFLANEYQTNRLGNVATRFRISGLFTSSSGGTVVPPALIDHDVLIGAIGRKSHDQIDAELTTLSSDVSTINGQITTINNDITNINNDITTINNDITTINNDLTGKLNIDGSNSMTGDLDMSTNNISWNSNASRIEYVGSDLNIVTNDSLDIQATNAIALISSDLMGFLSTNNMNIRSSDSDVRIRANLGDILLEPVVGNVIINELTNSYKLPATRGTAGQVITDTLGDGVLSWENGTTFDQPLNKADDVEFKSVTTTNIDGGPVLSIGATTSQLNLGQSGINILANGTLDCKEDIECDGDILLADGGEFRIGSTSVPSQDKCISMLFLAGSSFGKGRVLKIIDDAGTAKVVPITAGDPDATGVIGINMEAATLNQNVPVCIGAIFEVSIQNNITINIGDKLEKSDTAGQDGRVFGAPATTGSPGQFGVALTSGTGNVAGTEYVRGIFMKNETF